MTTRTHLESSMLNQFGEWDDREKPTKVFVYHTSLFPRAPLLEFGPRAVYTFSQHTDQTIVKQGTKANIRLWVSEYRAKQTMHVCAGVSTSKKRKAGEFLVLQHTDGDSGPYVIYAYLSTDEDMVLTQDNGTDFDNRLIQLLSNSENKQIPSFLKDPSSALAYTWADHAIDFGQWVWKHICTVLGHRVTGQIEASAFLHALRYTPLFVTGDDAVKEMKRLLPYLSLNATMDNGMVNEERWLQLVCLFADETKTTLGIPVINCRRAVATLEQCFMDILKLEDAERYISEGHFMVRISENYWRFGCFELTWQIGGMVRNALFAHHVPGDPVLITLGFLGTPHFALCRNAKPVHLLSQGAAEIGKELLNQKFYYIVQTEVEPSPDTIEAILPDNLSVFHDISELFTYCRQSGLEPLDKSSFLSYE